MGSLDDRVIAIAGAAGGLGPTVARRLAADGASLALTDVSQERLDALAAELGLEADRLEARAVDLLDPDAAQAWASALTERFGRVDGLLHLVGGWKGGDPIATTPLADYEWLHDLLVRTVQHATRAFFGPLAESGHGRFVLVSSSQAQAPDGTNASYAATKAAAESWTLALADSFSGTGATANVVVVNAIETPAMREANPGKERGHCVPLLRRGRANERQAPRPASVSRVHDFASDNHAGAHPDMLAAIAAANEGHAGSYGSDDWTERTAAAFRRHFGPAARAFPVFNGTAANVLALDAITARHEAVICTESAHLNVDECGAPERIAGVKLLTVATEHGKLSPDEISRWEARRGDEHHVQPRAVSITQATELGTVYTAAETTAICSAAHELGMLVHLDGARLANAAASLGEPLAALTTEAGVDVVSFGGTKNGLLGADAVVFLNPGLARDFEYERKQLMQLASKMRFLSAQLEALLDGELWLENARNANAMAALLAERVAAIGGVAITHPVEANAVFARLPRKAIDRLLADLPGEHPFYVWDDAASEVRWMCSWDTKPADVDEFVAALVAAAALQ